MDEDLLKLLYRLIVVYDGNVEIAAHNGDDITAFITDDPNTRYSKSVRPQWILDIHQYQKPLKPSTYSYSAKNDVGAKVD
jgi:hypothetical protein